MQWFSNATCNNSSDEEEEKPVCVILQDGELSHTDPDPVRESETEEVKELEQKKKEDFVENRPHAPLIAQDELLVQGFILSEPHSLAVSSLPL